MLFFLATFRGISLRDRMFLLNNRNVERDFLLFSKLEMLNLSQFSNELINFERG